MLPYQLFPRAILLGCAQRQGVDILLYKGLFLSVRLLREISRVEPCRTA